MHSKIHHKWLLRASFVGLSLGCCVATAHETHKHQIQQLDDQFDQLSSADSEETLLLKLRRADLYRRQLDWDAALLDYQHVADIDPDNLSMMFGRAQLHLDQHEYVLAVDWSARLMHLYPAHALAGLLHARALAGSGNSQTASIVFDRSIRQLDKPKPEHFLEQAQIMLAGKRDSGTRRQAIAIIDAGAEALAHPVSLHSVAYELEIESGNPAAALRRIDSVLARNSTLLNWRLRRGELLLEMGSQAEAREELQCLINRIQQLPEQRRLSRASQAMTKRSKELLGIPHLTNPQHSCDDSDV